MGGLERVPSPTPPPPPPPAPAAAHPHHCHDFAVGIWCGAAPWSCPSPVDWGASIFPIPREGELSCPIRLAGERAPPSRARVTPRLFARSARRPVVHEQYHPWPRRLPGPVDGSGAAPPRVPPPFHAIGPPAGCPLGLPPAPPAGNRPQLPARPHWHGAGGRACEAEGGRGDALPGHSRPNSGAGLARRSGPPGPGDPTFPKPAVFGGTKSGGGGGGGGGPAGCLAAERRGGLKVPQPAPVGREDRADRDGPYLSRARRACPSLSGPVQFLSGPDSADTDTV